MQRKQMNLGQLLLRYWFIFLIALVGFGFVSGYLPKKIEKFRHSISSSNPAESERDSLNKVEQEKERREILNN